MISEKMYTLLFFFFLNIAVEGWIIIITNIHGEAREDYIKEVFEEFGQIRNLHLNLDRRTGFIKGYAFLEFENFVDAKRAIDGMPNEYDIIYSTNYE